MATPDKVPAQKLKFGVTTSLLNKGKIKFEICDMSSSIRFLVFEMDSHEFLGMLRSNANVRACGIVKGLDKVGMIQENKQFEFPMPENTDLFNRKELAKIEQHKYIPEGWVSDNYFESQNSFFNGINDHPMARVSIRRWVKNENPIVDENEEY